MYYRPATNEVFLSHSEIRTALWQSDRAVLESVITDAALEESGVFPLLSKLPAVESGAIAVPTVVSLIDGEWVQQWEVRAATQEEIEAQKPPVPHEVTMRQARLALLGIGALARVAPAIEALEGDEREIARIEWEFSSTVVRDRQLVVMLGQALGLDSDALDQLFITAAGL